MSGVVALVNAISVDVVAKLAAASYPPLIDGAIVIGRVREQENTYVPRVIFIPMGSTFGPKSTPTRSSPMQSTNANATGTGVRSYTMTGYGGGYTAPIVTISPPNIAGGVTATATATVTSNGAISNIVATAIGSGYTSPPTVTIVDSTGSGASASPNMEQSAQALAVMQNRAILTDEVQFEVQCWNAANPTPDPNADFDWAQLLYQQVIASTHLVAAGVYTIGRGQWLDSKPGSVQLDLVGHVFSFPLSLKTPLVDQPLVGYSTQFAPVGTQANPTLTLQPFAGGTPGTAQSG